MCSEPGFEASVSGSLTTTGKGSPSKAEALGREALAPIASVASPATLLRWWRAVDEAGNVIDLLPGQPVRVSV